MARRRFFKAKVTGGGEVHIAVDSVDAVVLLRSSGVVHMHGSTVDVAAESAKELVAFLNPPPPEKTKQKVATA